MNRRIIRGGVVAIAAALLAIVAVIAIAAPSVVGDMHYYHHDLTEENAEQGCGFDYGPSDSGHLTNLAWCESFKTRLSQDSALLADWYFILAKGEGIDQAAKYGNELEPILRSDETKRQQCYDEVCAKLNSATIDKVEWGAGTKYHTGIMRPEAPTTEVPVLDATDIIVDNDKSLTVMVIRDKSGKRGDGNIIAYCVPGCGDQPAELLGGGSAGTGSWNNPYGPNPNPNPNPDPDPDPDPDGCSDTQTWTPSYGQQAEHNYDDDTHGGNVEWRVKEERSGTKDGKDLGNGSVLYDGVDDPKWFETPTTQDQPTTTGGQATGGGKQNQVVSGD